MTFKRWPDTLEIELTEHRAFARWGEKRLISELGAVFEAPGGQWMEGLPHLDGPEERRMDVIRVYREATARLRGTGLGIDRLRLSPRGSWSLSTSDGARWMVNHLNVDPKRIGIYGGSYGGFITLMAMFTRPEVVAAGAALRPVTDWAHYHQSYTSNILNQPQDDEESYLRSSPIYFAEGLQGALLICHGMVDTNVHFQDTVRLTERLIQLRKENWETAIFPVENHGFQRSDSWVDEYKRILNLVEANLKPAR